MDHLALVGNARRAARHHAPALRFPNGLTVIGLAGLDVGAIRIFGNIEQDDVITRLDRRDAAPDLFYDPTAFLTEDRGKQPFRIAPG